MSKNKTIKHNQKYSIFIGTKRVEARVLLFNSSEGFEVSQGFAQLSLNEPIFSIYKEKIIIRQSNDTIAGATVLNPIIDPMKKSQKLNLLEALEKEDIENAYKILLEAHKKGLGLISSAQRFALSHEKALEFAKSLKNVFIDEDSLILYPIETKQVIKDIIVSIYKKNQYALLSVSSIALRLKWASENFIQIVMTELVNEKFLVQDGKLYKSSNIKEDFKKSLENIILKRLEQEDVAPTAPYNIYDDLDIDRKMGDNILKSLCAKKSVIRLQHNIFIHSESLSKIILEMKNIIRNEGFIDISNFKEKFPLSRKYLISYLDYLDNFSEIKKEENKRVFIS
ncbi:MAG: SelB C-terminal domain-containing protein [Halarcobacter ebronensis]